MSEAWTEIRVEVPVGWQELVAEALAAETAGATVIGRATIGTRPPAPGCELVRAYLRAGEDRPERRARLAAALAGLAERAGAPALAGLAPAWRRLPPEDYARSWRKVWRPFRVGHLTVLPPWDAAPRRPTDLVMVLEPGSVFGTGRHATTRTVLAFLTGVVRPGDRIVDAGTGSGILAVAAALLGAADVLGFDSDPLSEPAAARLARANRVSARCRFRTGGFEELEATRDLDGVTANIYHDVLAREAAGLARALRPGGWFIASGCSLPHEGAVAAAFAAAGLAVSETRRRGRWVTFAGRRVSRGGGSPAPDPSRP